MSRGLLQILGRNPTQLSPGWGSFPLGDGGLITGVDVVNTGSQFGAVCKTDVAGAYGWIGSQNRFKQVCNKDSLSGIGSSPPVANGMWEMRVAPTNPNRFYMMWDQLSGTFGQYAVYVTTTAALGTGSWTQTPLLFRTQGYSYWSTDIANDGATRLGTGKMLIDPANELVCYIGIPKGCILMGAYAGQNPGIWKTVDGGANWTPVTDIPLPAAQPGYCGMVMDPNYPTSGSSTTVVGGVTVTKRIIIPVSGRGIWESTNGGVSWTQISADPQSTSLTYTTSTNNSMIMVQAGCIGYNEVVSVTATAGPAGITYPATFIQRASPYSGTTIVPAVPRGVLNNFAQGVCFEHYLLCPNAGTYSITIQYADGSMSFRRDDSFSGPLAKATCASGSFSNSGGSGGGVFTEGGAATGAFAVGMNLNTFNGLINGNFMRIKSLISTSPNKWQMDSYINLPISDPVTGFFWGSLTPAYCVNVFAVNNVDMVTPFATPNPPVQPITQYIPVDGIGTNATGLVIMMVATNYGGSPSPSPDSGYQLMGCDTDVGFWTEISSSPQAAGSYAPQTGQSPSTYVIDAIKQGSGTITIDPNGFQQFTLQRLPRSAQPCNVEQAGLDASGTYWVMNGPMFNGNPTSPNPVGPGGIHRYMSGSWDRIDGSLPAATYASQTFALAPGWPPDKLFGALAVDPRPGHTGRVMIPIENVTHSVQTLNGNAALNSITWTDTGNPNGGSVPSTTITSSIGWLNFGTQAPSGFFTTSNAISFDPITGDMWFACGYGILNMSSVNYTTPYSFIGVNNAQGIEEMIVQAFLSPPGASRYPLVGVQDEMCMLAGNPVGAIAIVQQVGSDAHCWSIDYASDNPAFVAALVLSDTQFGATDNSGFSIGYGDVGTWHNFNRSFAVNAGSVGSGGCIACASVGADGLIAGNATACMLSITGVGVQTVKYTTNNGTTAWNTCTWAPADNYGQFGIQGSPTQSVAADRVNIGTYYIYAPSTGVWRTTDFGATGSLISSVKPTTGPITLLTTPGHAGHVWMAALGPSGPIYFTPNAGVTAFTNINTDVTCVSFSMGKAFGGGYPTLFIIGVVTGSSALGGNAGKTGYWRSIDQGATWTLFGQASDYDPVGGFWSSPSFVRGDWNVFGRVYSAWGAAGAIYYTP
jgi:hypothetical protein